MKKPSHFIDKAISAERERLQNPYAFQNDTGDYDAIILNKAASHKAAMSELQNKNLGNKKPYASIERKARELQASIWKNRHKLWPESVPTDPVEMLDPITAIRHLGFEFELSEHLGEFRNYGSVTEIAGIIDRASNKISISNRLKPETHRFTIAHELGHAILHQGTMMHRDRPIDGSNKTTEPREPIEKEADKFAVFFLMPEKLIRERFISIFYTDKFQLTDETAYALATAKSANVIKKCKTSDDLARILAKTEYYNGYHFNSLAKQFGVSVGAMAIRIQELNLIQL